MSALYNAFENKTVLITGATGLLGYHLVSELINKTKSCTVLALGRDTKKLETIFTKFADCDRLKLFNYATLGQIDSYSQYGKINYLFHAGGPQERDIVINRPLDVVDANVDGVRNCFNLLRAQQEELGCNGRLVVFSSLTIYGTNPLDGIVTLDENDSNKAEFLNASTSVYSESKRMSEVIAQSYHKMFGIDFVVCRISTAFGAAKIPTKTAFFEFLKLAKMGDSITIAEKFGPKRDNIYVADAVNGILYAAAFGQSAETYNVSSNGDLFNFLSISEIAQIIADVSNKILHNTEMVHVSFTNQQIRDPSGFRLDNTKLKSLGWSIKRSYREAIEEIFMLK